MTYHDLLRDEKVAKLCRRYHVRRMYLFGSALREDFGPESDLDVLVEFEPEAEIGLMRFSRMQRELESILQRPVDLVPRDGLRPWIREVVLDNAEVVYAA